MPKMTTLLCARRIDQVENKLLHYLIAYIMVQRNTNHAHPTINDLKLMFAIRECIMVNWHA
ncbi:hypothetical protein Lal_00026486 [Lupinus albus]|nr:hypothetical protein Lal_00026486 [Lupinus albus]